MKKQQKMKVLYLLDSQLKWKPFKELHDKIVRDSGPVLINGTKILWEMMRSKQIYCWYQLDDRPNDKKKS